MSNRKSKLVYSGTYANNEVSFEDPSPSDIHGYEMSIRQEDAGFYDGHEGMAYGKTPEECLENARLFSSASEMLQTLKDAQAYIQFCVMEYGSDSDMLQEIEEVIKNAT